MLVILNNSIIKEGDTLIVTKEARCRGDIHEETNYPRSWFKAKKSIKEGAEVVFVDKWSNCFGSYFRVKYDDKLYDLKESELIMKPKN